MLKKFEGERKKQLIAFVVAVVVVGGGILFLSEALKSDKKPQTPTAPPVKIETPQPQQMEEESFKAIYGKKLTEIEEKLKRIEERQENLQKTAKEPQSAPPPVLPPSLSPSPSPPPPPPPQESFNPPPPPQQQQAPPPKPKLETDLIVLKKQETQAQPQAQQQSAQERQVNQKQADKKSRQVIPAGSFVRAVLLSGLDAPTGGKAQTSPHPVLMRITDKAVLPNLWKADIKDCFVIGSGYGDLPSERAYIRLEVLSCVKKDGTVEEKSVKGYVAGEDGKVGLLGRVVSKQGAILARLLLAGFVDGLARVIGQSATTVVVAPQGTLSTINPSQALQAGLAGGFSSAAKELVEQYKKLADETYPVVEINAGRQVDLVFLQGVDFSKSQEQGQSQSQEQRQEKVEVKE